MSILDAVIVLVVVIIACSFGIGLWETLMAVGALLSVLVVGGIIWGTAVYLNRPSRRR